jgi:prepilin-type N-terminal cleavage/methylation domain-containing protein
MNKFSLTSAFNSRGFTLLEILIAITLLAFITLGVVSITENANITKERTTEINKNNLQVETAMSRFEWDFSQIYSPLYFSQVLTLQSLLQVSGQAGNPPEATRRDQDDPGLDSGIPAPSGVNPQLQVHLQEYFQQLVQRFERNEHFMAVSQEGLPIPRFSAPDRQTFEFFTSSNRRKVENVKQSHFAWVRYGLADQGPRDVEEENPNIPRSLKSLVRYFSADDPYGDRKLDTDQIKATVLLENVESLEFQFWDFTRRKWETSLRSIPQGENVIRGVKMSLAWYDSTGIKRTTTRIFRNHWPMVVPINPQQGGARGTTPRGVPRAQGDDFD